MIMRKIFTAILFLPFLLLASCAEWLDVQPKTSVEEEDLFSSEYGFKDALTGFYIKMGKTDLYGQTMTYYYLDMLAGRYNNDPEGILDTSPSTVYAYDGTYEGTVINIYSSLYNVIANINNFLKFVDQNRSVIHTENYYETMKGEALGLRAFLHFDLLRLYGPVYKDNPQGDAVPYRISFDNVATPILPASEVLDLVIADLLEAEKLLDGHDSEIFNYDDTADPFTEMRQMRMNVWAVRAMLARAYCYRGDEQSKALALQYARSVIDCGHFTLAGTDDYAATPITPTEQIFALYIDDYYQIIDQVFTNVSYSNSLAAYQTNVTQWYEVASDARYRNFSAPQGTAVGQPLLKCNKYIFTGSAYTEGRGNYNGLDSQPLIRLPEMYYIAAECTPDVDEAASYLDEVIALRSGRYNATFTTGFDETDTRQIFGVMTGQTVRTNELMKEYLKEFYGEGQLFFFYKRFGFTAFPNCPAGDTMPLANYQMPLPDDEYTYGNHN